MSAIIHPTAEVEEGVEIGDGTRIWSHVHVRVPARIGRDCIVGEKTYIAYDVEIGDCVKLNAFVYVCAGVRIERGVMVAAGVIFSNDRFPRAADPQLLKLLPSEPDESTGRTRVEEGASLGAGARIGPDLRIGRFAMLGMAAVVTRDVPDHHLVVGQPARSVGIVCRCGRPLHRFSEGEAPAELVCGECGSVLEVDGGILHSTPGRSS